jgi:hypothetical protein
MATLRHYPDLTISQKRKKYIHNDILSEPVSVANAPRFQGK